MSKLEYWQGYFENTPIKHNVRVVNLSSERVDHFNRFEKWIKKSGLPLKYVPSSARVNSQYGNTTHYSIKAPNVDIILDLHTRFTCADYIRGIIDRWSSISIGCSKRRSEIKMPEHEPVSQFLTSHAVPYRIDTENRIRLYGSPSLLLLRTAIYTPRCVCIKSKLDRLNDAINTEAE